MNTVDVDSAVDLFALGFISLVVQLAKPDAIRSSHICTFDLERLSDEVLERFAWWEIRRVT